MDIAAMLLGSAVIAALVSGGMTMLMDRHRMKQIDLPALRLKLDQWEWERTADERAARRASEDQALSALHAMTDYFNDGWLTEDTATMDVNHVPLMSAGSKALNAVTITHDSDAMKQGVKLCVQLFHEACGAQMGMTNNDPNDLRDRFEYIHSSVIQTVGKLRKADAKPPDTPPPPPKRWWQRG